MKPGYVAFVRAVLHCLLLSSCSVLLAGQPSFEKDVIVVDFNDQSAATLGQKWNRDYLAAITEKLVEGKVRAVVIKVFMDSPGNEAVDARLEKAMKSGRVILQASINTEPPVSSELEDRFEYRGSASGVKAQISGKTGWLPIARFQNAAAKVCFADVQVVTIAPLVEELGSRLYKSLYSCILEEAAGAELVALGPKVATIGSWQLPVTPEAGVSIGLKDTSFPEHLMAEEVLLAKQPPSSLEGKIAIVSYSGSKSPTIPVAGNPVKVHQAFLAVLRDVFGTIQPVPH